MTTDSPELHGHDRASERWELAAVYHGRLVAAFELESRVGSAGANDNDRFEESLGSATDVHADGGPQVIDTGDGG